MQAVSRKEGCLPRFKADPARHGCRIKTMIGIVLTEKLILIGGTAYADEMKKSWRVTLAPSARGFGR